MNQLKIEMPSNDLKDLRSFLLNAGDELEVEELNEITPGFNREPIVIALIVALGGPIVTQQVVSLIKEWLKVRHEDKNLQHEEKLVKLSLLSNDGKRQVTLKELQSV